AAAARLGAHAAVRHRARVIFAFLPARPARFRTRVERTPQHAVVRAGTPRRDGAGGRAQAGAVEIEANALNEIGDVLLAEAGIRARRASLGAVVAGLDTANERGAFIARGVGMGRYHILGVHEGPPWRFGLRRKQTAPNAVPSLPAVQEIA